MRGSSFIMLGAAVLFHLVYFIGMGVYQMRKTLLSFAQEAEAIPVFLEVHWQRIAVQTMLAVVLFLIGVVLVLRRVDQ